MKFDHRNRALFIALALSVLLHLVLVFGWGGVRPVPLMQQAPAVLVVVAAPSKSPASRGGGTVPPAPPRSAAAKSPALSMPKPVTEKLPLAQEKAVAPPPVVARNVETGPAPAKLAAASNVSALAPSASPERKVPAGVPMAGESALRDGVPPDAMRQYRIDLAVAARRFRHYPAAARARGWEGVAEVVVLVRADTASPRARLLRSTGHDLLDEAAIEMLVRAAAETPLPDSLRGRSFEVPMPIRFSLEE